MNVAAGFSTGFSFFHSSSAPGFVNVYEGLNATGACSGSARLVV